LVLVLEGGGGDGGGDGDGGVVLLLPHVRARRRLSVKCESRISSENAN
jgi:hypothetical protein